MFKKIDRRFIINLIIFLVFISIAFIYEKFTGEAISIQFTLTVVVILFVYNYYMLEKYRG